jgi:hypothetical protein
MAKQIASVAVFLIAACGGSAKEAPTTPQAPTIAFVGEAYEVIGPDKEQLFAVTADGRITKKGEHIATIRPVGELLDKNGEVVLSLQEDGAVRLGEQQIASVTDDKIMNIQGETVLTMTPDGLVEANNQKSVQFKGPKAARRTALFILTGYLQPAKVETGPVEVD